jgi:hypothetical protein
MLADDFRYFKDRSRGEIDQGGIRYEQNVVEVR